MLSISFLQITLNYRMTEKYFSFWVVLITLAISIALVYLVEKPLNKLRQNRAKV
jgi:peptidoglycan/LPS O-acetylase OafA/YrhL